MEEITKIESIDQYDQLFGLETLHPLVNVIDFSKATKTVDYYRMNIGFYSLFLKDAKCGDLRYGRKYYDYQEGTVVCMKVSDLKEKGFEQIVQISAKEQTGIEELYQLIQDTAGIGRLKGSRLLDPQIAWRVQPQHNLAKTNPSF